MTVPTKHSKPMTTCPTCKSPVRVDNLEKHLKKHNGGMSPTENPGKSSSTVKKNPAGVKPYKQTKPKPPGRARCPYCNEFYPLSEINAHKAGCPKNVYQIGASKETKIKQLSQKYQTQSNRCPNCGNIINFGNRGHTKNCPARTKFQIGLKPQSNNYVSGSKYFIDEYGVVRIYSAWVDDQKLGESSKSDNAPPPSPHTAGKVYTACPLCGVSLKQSRLLSHISAHNKKPKD